MTGAKFFVVLRIRLSKQIKKVRVSFWKYTKYRVIVIPKANFDKAKKEPLFVTAIQLGRLVNSLTSAQSIPPNTGLGPIHRHQGQNRTTLSLVFSFV